MVPFPTQKFQISVESRFVIKSLASEQIQYHLWSVRVKNKENGDSWDNAHSNEVDSFPKNELRDKTKEYSQDQNHENKHDGDKSFHDEVTLAKEGESVLLEKAIVWDHHFRCLTSVWTCLKSFWNYWWPFEGETPIDG